MPLWGVNGDLALIKLKRRLATFCESAVVDSGNKRGETPGLRYLRAGIGAGISVCFGGQRRQALGVETYVAAVAGGAAGGVFI